MSANPLPLYHQVYLLLKQRLASGDFSPDQPMPGENALAAEYGVSRLTIRRSLESLEAEGLIQRRQGRGTFARPASPIGSAHASDIDTLMDHLANMGTQTQVRLVSLQVEPASAQAAERLELPLGTQVDRAVRVRSHAGQPFSYLTTHVPHSIGRRIPRKTLASKPLLAIFRDLGLRVTHAEQSLSAALAEPDAAAALGVPVGSALLSLHRVVRDSSNQPIEWLHALYRPDRYEYRMNMQAHDMSGEPAWLPAAAAPRRRRA